MPYNRNKFLQANFRFLVCDAGNLKKHEADADLMLDWDDVVQVIMMTGGEVQCPISLETNPLCPQITPCGHVFAFHSIMQHLMTQGGEDLRKAARCPLCYSMVAARELKLVQVHRIHVPQVNDTVTFRLLQRARESIIPKEVPNHPHATPCPTSTKQEDPTSTTPLSTWGSARHDATAITAVAIAATAPGQTSKPYHRGDKKSDTKGKAALDPKSSIKSRGRSHKQDIVEGDDNSGRGFNKYAKFTTVGDGKAFWKAAAEELARYAAQLTAEGGWDAAQEAPFLYAAMDALAARAGTWTERRQRLKMEAASEQAASMMAEPVVVSREAIAFVKQFSTAAVHAAEEQRAAASKEAKHQEVFPSLSSSSTLTRPAQSTGTSSLSTPQPKLTPLVRLPQKGSTNTSPASGPAAAPAGHPQAAFSDDEAEEQGAEPTAAVAAAEETEISQNQGSQQEGVASAEPPDSGLGTSPAGTSGAVPVTSTEFYFYQSADGQCIFLHPLVSRALLAHYGSYAACPPEVAGQILEVEDMVQTDATRKRMKHLAHLPLSVQRADCARYFYMLQYGGCYFDLDFESLKPLEPLLADVQVALGYMSKNIPHELSIPNAFLASVPGHTFWHYVVKHVLKNYESGKVNVGDALTVTGPIMLKEAVADYQSTAMSKDLTIFPSDKVYGVDWLWRDDKSMQSVFSVCHAANPHFNSTQCKSFFPDAFAITYWSGDITWG
ncbi:TPA: hypothetical protein ACH3X1_000206 [Trebouxia sp. C0004]